MVALAALGFAIGIVLALFFRALVLAPATLISLVGASLIEATRGHSAAHSLLTSLCIALALQLGFLGGGLFNGLVQRAKAFGYRVRKLSARHHRLAP
jgi:hypothetical protein